MVSVMCLPPNHKCYPECPQFKGITTCQRLCLLSIALSTVPATRDIGMVPAIRSVFQSIRSMSVVMTLTALCAVHNVGNMPVIHSAGTVRELLQCMRSL